MRQMTYRAWRAKALGGGLMTAAVVLWGGAMTGCRQDATKPAAPTMTEGPAMSQTKMEALMSADSMISDGQHTRDEGMRMRADGKNGDDLVKQGEAKITEGFSRKEKAMTMPD